MMEEKIFKTIGEIIAYCGGLVTIAYLIFHFLGKKTLETWFDKRLKKFEYEMNSLFNRVTKIHEKEIEVLPNAWGKLNDLLYLAIQFIRETHKITLDERTAPDLEKYLSKQNLTKEEKRIICDSSDKNKRFFYVLSEKVSNACMDFQEYIEKNGIFLSPDIKNKFKEAEEFIRTAWAERCEAEESDEKWKGIKEACQIISKKIPPITEEIEELVQKRLRFHDA